MARILVVDDEKDVLEAIKMGLESLGHQVWATTEGDIAAMAVQLRDIELVITDIMMPKFDGIEVVTTVRKQKKDVRILAISGREEQTRVSYLEMASKLGADAALQKPVNLSQISDLIEDWGLVA